MIAVAIQSYKRSLVLRKTACSAALSLASGTLFSQINFPGRAGAFWQAQTDNFSQINFR